MNQAKILRDNLKQRCMDEWDAEPDDVIAMAFGALSQLAVCAAEGDAWAKEEIKRLAREVQS